MLLHLCGFSLPWVRQISQNRVTGIIAALMPVDYGGRMESQIAKAIGLQTHVVALAWADTPPEGALQFKHGDA
ncbi:MAG: hypothetical protein ACM3JB_05180 [Acidobacteriaceae bacterium]